MARNLESEKPFLVVVNDDIKQSELYYGIRTGYATIQATIINIKHGDPFPDIPEKYGTVVHIDEKENISSTLSSLALRPGVRYIGYCIMDDKIECILTNSKCNGYVAIPICRHLTRTSVEIPSDMIQVVYPHITLAPPMNANQFNSFLSLLGSTMDIELSDDLIYTPNTICYSAVVHKDEHHITLYFKHGKSPAIAKKEMEGIRGKYYYSVVGYPIIL
jgi:hypothetical protein